MTEEQGNPRRAVSQPFEDLRAWGRDEDAAILKEAWLASKTDIEEPLTHALHPYPGRMHWAMARELVKGYGKRGQSLLDPFAGGGTTVLEGMLAGLKPHGVDLNPLMVPITKCKTRITSEQDRREFVAACEQVFERSEERIRARAKAKIPLPRDLSSWYESHVLFELSGLLEEIQGCPQVWRTPMEVLFSALSTKFSVRRSETAAVRTKKRIRKGLASEFFLRRANQLARQWEELEAMGRGQQVRWSKPTLVRGDSMDLRRTLGGNKKQQFDLVVTSPPYAGTYDYYDHHELRLAWLGIRSKQFVQKESGSKREFRDASGHRWHKDLCRMLRSISSVCAPDAPIAFVLGDGRAGTKKLSAVAGVERAAKESSLSFVAAATVKRPTSDRTKSRTEAVILLRNR